MLQLGKLQICVDGDHNPSDYSNPENVAVFQSIRFHGPLATVANSLEKTIGEFLLIFK